MPYHVCNGATLACTFGALPSTFVVLPTNRVLTSSQPAANIMDYVPMTNVMPFGMCSAPTNPQVISATAAASGVFTPQPCVPAIVSPWTPGVPTVLVANQPSVDNNCILNCTWLGVISVTNPGQARETIP